MVESRIVVENVRLLACASIFASTFYFASQSIFYLYNLVNIYFIGVCSCNLCFYEILLKLFIWITIYFIYGVKVLAQIELMVSFLNHLN